MTTYAFSAAANYFNTESELRGCLNDQDDMYDLFIKSGVKPENITRLSDNPKRQDKLPTRDNILTELSAMGKKLKKGDTLLVHWSGHGLQTRDHDADEADRKDEAIYTQDDQIITDDEFYALMRKIPVGVNAFVIMDCCHSESVVDLAEGLDRLSSKRKPDNSHGFVFQISGCKDPETSADALLKHIKSNSKHTITAINNREIKDVVKGKAPRFRGALTAAFLSTVDKQGGLQPILNLAFNGTKKQAQGLQKDLRNWMVINRFSQNPCISYEGAKTVRTAVKTKESEQHTDTHRTLTFAYKLGDLRKTTHISAAQNEALSTEHNKKRVRKFA